MKNANAPAVKREAERIGAKNDGDDRSRPRGAYTETNRPSGHWNDDDFDVLAGSEVVGRIFKANAAPVGSPWMGSLAFEDDEDRTPTHGYAERS
jgi:hypothetical protein